jgi:hypothetical protein
LLVGQYHPQLSALAAELTAKGISPNSLGGPGSVLCSFPGPTEKNYGYLFFIEFFVDSFIVRYTDFLTWRTNADYIGHRNLGCA